MLIENFSKFFYLLCFFIYHFKSQFLDDYAIMMAVWLELFWAFAIVFTLCEFGHRIGNTYEEIDYEIGQFAWYSFPVEMWRMLPTLIFGVQQSVGINAFGIISCSREDFKKVNKIQILMLSGWE